MVPDPLPPSAAWRHQGLREGFEVAWFDQAVEGSSVALEAGQSWAVGYRILLDPEGRVRRAEVVGRSASRERSVRLEHDGAGHWRVDGRVRPELDGCLDVDLEASALTNAFPVRRLLAGGHPVGAVAEAPAAYLRAADLDVGRLEQSYRRIEDDAAGPRFDYRAPAFDFGCELRYDRAGLVLVYPGIAVRAL